MKTLFIRTEANEVIATGHMMRCIAIADAARKENISTVFIVAEQQAEQLPKQHGYETICLGKKWDDFDSEIPMMEQLIREYDVQVLLIDSYFVTHTYMAALKQLTQIAYIDDLHARVWPCNVIINYAVYAGLFDYEGEYPYAKKLLGCQYAPLRKEYYEQGPFRVSKEVKNILVVTGGTDEYHFLLTFAKRIIEKKEWGKIRFTMVCGKFNKDRDALLTLADSSDNIMISPPLPTLKNKMEESDMLVTAGGTTLYELSAVGVPGVCFCVADNQKYNVKGFSDENLLLYAGDIREDDFYEKLENSLEILIEDFELRERMSKELQRKTDGQGAGRIVRNLMGI